MNKKGYQSVAFLILASTKKIKAWKIKKWNSKLA
jgi:hypothetical protein